MMKKTSTILLAVLMLVINMSLTFSTHYCGGEAVDMSISLGKSDVGCGMEDTSDDDCENPTDDVSFSSNCCENVHYTFSLEEDYKENTAHEIVNYNLVVATIPTSANPSISYTQKSTIYKAYSPPLLRHSITVLHQVFRL